MASAPPAPPRFENLNLLRAAAALVVVVYHVIEHAQWKAFPASGPLVAFRVGWFGVDLFFVISGFVIAYSGLLLWRADARGFQRAYWARRLTRILPLYLLTLVLWLAVFQPGFLFAGWREWGWQLFTHLTFTHGFWAETHGAIDGPNWSLAVEMQFYLAMALAIGWIDRTPAWRIVLYALLVSWAYRFTMSLAYAEQGGGWVFMKTTQLPGMLDEFAMGIAAAKWVVDGGRRSGRAALAWTLAAVAAGVAAWSIYWPWSGYWDVWWMVTFWRTPLAIFFGCVLMAAVHLPAIVARRLKVLDWLGEVSYGLYLWHLFAIFAAIHLFGHDGPRVLAVALPATIVVSALSWKLVEKPFMRIARAGRNRAERREAAGSPRAAARATGSSP